MSSRTVWLSSGKLHTFQFGTYFPFFFTGSVSTSPFSRSRTGHFQCRFREKWHFVLIRCCLTVSEAKWKSQNQGKSEAEQKCCSLPKASCLVWFGVFFFESERKEFSIVGEFQNSPELLREDGASREHNTRSPSLTLPCSQVGLSTVLGAQVPPPAWPGSAGGAWGHQPRSAASRWARRAPGGAHAHHQGLRGKPGHPATFSQAIRGPSPAAGPERWPSRWGAWPGVSHVLPRLSPSPCAPTSCVGLSPAPGCAGPGGLARVRVPAPRQPPPDPHLPAALWRDR